MTKKCTKCNTERDVTYFYKNKLTKDGYSSECKECKKYYNKKYRVENKEKIKEYQNKWREENKEYFTEYYKENKEYFTEYRGENKKKIKEWCEENKEQRKKNSKSWREENKEQAKEYYKRYCDENYFKIKEYKKEYRKTYKARRNISNKHRRKTDSVFKFTQNIRSLILGSFKRNKNQFKKNAKTEDILGCTIEYFITYIESKFTEGMTIDNHGKWHLDHIIPLATAKTEEEIIKLNHYTNFQPLWAEDNFKKGSKL
jgi:hypothetical protein